MSKNHNTYEAEVKKAHEHLDKKHIPQGDSAGSFTLLYRIKLLEQNYLMSLSEVENYYLRKKE